MIENGTKLHGGYHVLTATPIDDRLLLTKEDLVKIQEGGFDHPGDAFDLLNYPDGYFAAVIDSEECTQFYLLDKKGTFADSEDSHLGFFHRVDYDYIKKHPFLNGKEIEGSHDAHYYLLQGLLHTSEGLYVDDSELRLLFDHKTLVIDANGNLSVPIDNHTIVVNSEGKIESAALPLKDGVATKILASEGYNFVNVLFDNETIALNSEGELMATTQLFADRAIEITSEGKISALFDGTILLDSANQMHVFHDQKSIKLGSEGLYVNLSDGKATKLNTSEAVYGVDVLVDDETIKINAANNLEVKLDKAIVKDSEGLSVNVDDKTIKVVNNKLEAQYKAGKALELTNSEVFNVLFDSEDLELDSQNRLKLVEKPKHKVEDGVATHVYYKLTPDSELTVDVLYDNKTVKVGSEGLFVDLDGKTLVQDANHVRVNIDNDTLFFDTSEEVLRAKQEAIVAGHAFRINPVNHIADVLYDDTTVKERADKKLYVPIDSETIKVINNKLTLNLDGTSVIYDASEDYIRVFADGKTILYKDDVTGAPIPLQTRIGGWRSNERQPRNFTATGVSAPVIGGVATLPMSYDAFGMVMPKPDDVLDIQGSYTVPDGFGGISTVPFVNNTLVAQPVVGQPTQVVFRDPGSFYPFEELLFDNATGDITFKIDGGTATSVIDFKFDKARFGAYEFHPIDAQYVPVDDKSVVLSYENGRYVISATAKDLFDGDAIHIDATNKINVLRDEKSIILQDSELAVKFDNNSIKLGANGLYANYVGDKGVKIITDSELHIQANYDQETLALDGDILKVFLQSEGGLVASPSGIYVDIDNDTIVIDSETKQIKVVRLVEDVEILADDSEGWISITSEDRVARLDLREYSVKDETANRIGFAVSSEGSLISILYNCYDSEISTSELALPFGNSLIDCRYVDDGSITSEGEPEGGALVFRTVLGETLIVRLDELVAGLVTKAGRQTVYGEKDFIGGLYKNGLEVLSAANIDDKTIIWNNSEKWIEARSLVVSEGNAIQLVDLGTDAKGNPLQKINVLFDDETIKLGTDNKLYLPIDRKTIIVNSENELMAIEHLEDGIATHAYVKGDSEVVDVLYDSTKAIGVDASNRLFIKTDSERVVFKQGKLTLPLDEVTVFYDSEDGLIKAAGLEVKAGDAIRIDSEMINGLPVSTVNVEIDSETVKLGLDNKLYIPIDRKTIIVSEGVLKAVEHIEDGIATHAWLNGDSEVVDVLVDNNTVYVNSEHNYLELHLSDSEGLEVNPAGELRVKIDDVTVHFNSEGELVAQGMLEGDAIHFRDSEGLTVIDVIFDSPLYLDSENQLCVAVDSETIIINSEGKLEANIDRDTLIINSEGKIAADLLTVEEVRDIWYSIVI